MQNIRKYNSKIDKYKCCGCSACKVRCSENAILMKSDIEGFKYPYVDSDKCIGCGICLNKCAFNKQQLQRKVIDEALDKNLKVFLGRHISKDIVEESRSGGIFTAVSDFFIENKGYIYGVILNKNLDVVYSCANNERERNKMRGSKYVQCNLNSEIYADIQKKLVRGKKILFTGTSCQVDAVKSLFGNENIFYMDIVCHGVVSPMVYKKYLEYLENKYSENIVDIDFRNKNKYGWREHIETFYFENNKILDSVTYRNIFYSLNAVRPSCSCCPYKSQRHPGDITIADCWGVEKIIKKYDDNKGCSLIFLNTDKGKKLFRYIKNNLDVEEVFMNEALFQTPLHKAYEINEGKREKFWNEFICNSDYVFEKYSN